MDWFLILAPLALLPIVWLIRLVGCIWPSDFDIDRPVNENLIAPGRDQLGCPMGGENPFFQIPCTVRLIDLPPTGDLYDIHFGFKKPGEPAVERKLAGLAHSVFQAEGTRLRWWVCMESKVLYETLSCEVFESGELMPIAAGICSPVEPLTNPDAIVKFERHDTTEPGLLTARNCLTPTE
jgi:hypothetical protein